MSRIPWRFYGVWLLPLGGLMGFAGYGSYLYTWPVFFPVVIKELGWSAAVAATASSLAAFHGGIEGPLVGWILDKYGPRVVMLFGGLCIGIGFISMYWMDNIVFYYIAFGVLINLGANAGLYNSSYKAVANWWVRWRARAISIMILPTGLAGTFGPSVGAWAIANYGWRTASLMLGILVLVIFIPAAMLIRPKRPEAYGLLPDGDDPRKVLGNTDGKLTEAQLAAATMQKEVDVTVRQALRTSVFWLVALFMLFLYFGCSVIVLFAPAHLVSRGFDMPAAAGFAGMMLACTYIGRLTVMAIGDIFSIKWLTILSMFICAGGAISMANASIDAVYLAYGYAILYGIGYGLWIPLTAALRGYFFGRSSFGTIGGIINIVAVTGSMFAPTFAGYIYDVTSTYYWAYMVFAGSYVLGGVVLVFAKRKAPQAVTATAPSAA